MKIRLMIAASLAATLLLAGCGGESHVSQRVETNKPSDPTTKSPAPAAPNPWAVWDAMQPTLERDRLESEAAIDRRIARIDEFFNDRKKRVPRFAKDMLGWDAKARVSASMVERSVNSAAGLLGRGPAFSQDSFKIFVQDTFRQQVLDPSELNGEVRKAIAGWAADWRELDAKMLVALKVDIDEKSLAFDTQGLSSDVALDTRFVDSILDKTATAVGNDIAQSIATFAVSWIVSDAVTGMVTSENDPTAKKLAVNFGVGMAVDKLLADQTAEARLTAVINASIDQMRRQVVLDASANRPGLRDYLYRLHASRWLRRRDAI
jgi:hypothetical protein